MSNSIGPVLGKSPYDAGLGPLPPQSSDVPVKFHKRLERLVIELSDSIATEIERSNPTKEYYRVNRLRIDKAIRALVDELDH